MKRAVRVVSAALRAAPGVPGAVYGAPALAAGSSLALAQATRVAFRPQARGLAAAAGGADPEVAEAAKRAKRAQAAYQRRSKALEAANDAFLKSQTPQAEKALAAAEKAKAEAEVDLLKAEIKLARAKGEDTAELKAELAKAEAVLAQLRGLPAAGPDLTLYKPLAFKAGEPFLHTVGAQFPYQRDAAGDSELVKVLSKNFEHRQNPDKQTVNLVTMAGGMGTGKSRALQEFPGRAVSLAKDNRELQEALRGAFVLHVSFENGTSGLFTKDETGMRDIGLRMLHQLVGGYFGKFASDPRNHWTPDEVLTRLAADRNLPKSKMSVIILVDGAHHLGLGTDEKKESRFAKALSGLHQMMWWKRNVSGPWVLPVVAATLVEPIDKWQRQSAGRFVNIPPPLIDPHLIVPSTNPFVRALAADTGGHARAVEVLVIALKELVGPKVLDGGNVQLGDVKPDAVFDAFARLLDDKYDFKSSPSLSEEVVKAVLLRKNFPGVDSVVYGTRTVDDVQSMGLVRYNSVTKVLECAFVLLYLAASRSAPRELRSICVPGYAEASGESHPDLANSPDNFERLVARYRTLRFNMLQDGVKGVMWRDVHAGAQFSEDESTDGVTVAGEKLGDVRVCAHRVPTTEVPAEIEVRGGLVPSAGRVFVNASGAPAADVFLLIKVRKDGVEETVLECLQAKRWTAYKVGSALIEAERAKAVGKKGRGFFVFVTTTDVTNRDWRKQPRTAVVSKTELKAYLGPVAARAFLLLDAPPAAQK